MLLERAHDLHQLVVGALVQVLEVGQRHGVAYARDDVLALGVLQVVAVDALRAAGRVAGERDAGAGVHAEVAEHHRADVDGGAQVGRDALLPPVDDRALGVPGLEHGPDRQIHLLTRILRERAAGVLDDDVLERLDQGPHVLGVQVEVARRVLGVFGCLDRILEVLAADIEDGLAEHLDQPTVGVEREPFVAGLRREPPHGLVVEPDVEDGLHHPGHRESGAGTDRHQQRVVGLPELLAHRALQRLEVFGHLGGQLGRLSPALQVRLAGFGGDREAGRHRQAQVRHLGEVGALATQQVAQVPVAFGEVIDVLGHARVLLGRRRLSARA